MFESKSDTADASIIWTKEAQARLERAPIFLRGMVKRLADRKATELGYREIPADILDQSKRR